MKEFIEEIIEIILEDVSCHHDMEEPSSSGPGYDDVTYSLNDEKAVVEKCLKIIMMNKPVITGEFIKKKTKELHDKLWPCDKFCGDNCSRQAEINEFLSSLLNEESCSQK